MSAELNLLKNEWMNVSMAKELNETKGGRAERDYHCACRIYFAKPVGDQIAEEFALALLERARKRMMKRCGAAAYELMCDISIQVFRSSAGKKTW